MAEPASDSTPRSVVVFLSYAHEDTDVAQRVAEALRAAGVSAWFDESELRGGDAWDAHIRQHIRDCAMFVPIISANTQARREGYFRLEWKLADERSHQMAEGTPFILPVVADSTKERDALVPKSFLNVQWTWLRFGEVPAAFVARVSQLVGCEMTQAPFILARPAPAPVAETRRGIPAWAWIAIVAVLAGLVFAWQCQRRPAEPATAPAATSAPAAKPPLDFASAKSIAVLPFVNLGADKTEEYLGDGMTEELLNALAKVKGLRVPGRSSSFAFKGRTGEDIFRQVGEKLRVSSVLEGSVRKTGNRVRITTQLINVADGFHLWSETYDRDLTDLFAIQTDVAQRVVQALQVTLGVEESRALAKHGTENAEAHRLYLLGRYHFSKNTEAGWTSAAEHFNAAIRLDPSYALAYCGLADNYGWLGGFYVPAKEAWAKEKVLAQKALALDPDLAEAHLSLGIALCGEFDWPGVERAFNRALELNPKLALAYDQIGFLRVIFGRFDEAVASSKKAIELDPLSPLLGNDLAWWFYAGRRYDETIAQARTVLAMDANYAMGHAVLGWSLLRKGDMAGAISEFERGKSLDPQPYWDAVLGYTHGTKGERAKAEQILRDLEELAKKRYVSPTMRMLVYLGLGEKERALDWLEKSYADRDWCCWWLKVEPFYDGVRDEPRFQALLKKVGLER